MDTKKLLRSNEQIREETKELILKIGQRRSADICGLHESTLSLFVNGHRTMKIENVIEIYEKLRGDL